MKQFILPFLLILSLASSGQITREEPVEKTVIGSLRPAGKFLAELSFSIIEGDTVYSIMYRNLEYESLVDIQSIIFDGSDGVLDTMYNIIAEVFETKKKISFVLGEDRVQVYFHSTMGIKYVNVWGERGYFNLTRKQLDKLFGKTKSE